MTRCCAVYEMPFGYLIHPLSRTVDGAWIFHGPVVRHPKDIDELTLGSTIEETLGESQVDIPHPKDWAAFNAAAKDLLGAQGVSSFTALQRYGSEVSIEADRSCFRLTPSRNGGLVGCDKGFHRVDDEVVQLTRPIAPVELGAALKSALSLCR